MNAEFHLDFMRSNDSAQVLDIYRMGIASGQATFETEVPDWETWDASHLKTCRLVARMGDIILGWAALSPISKRTAYRGVAEISIYIHTDYRGKGIGKALLNKLVQCSEDAGFWTLQSSTFSDNTASIELQKTVRVSHGWEAGQDCTTTQRLAGHHLDGTPQQHHRSRLTQ